MSKPLHIQLLEKLEKYGIGHYVDIAQFMKEHFSIPVNKNNPSEKINDAIPELFLDDLQERGIINIQIESSGVWIFEQENDFYTPYWRFDNIQTQELNYFLTSIGLDYLEQYRALKAVKLGNLKAWIALIIAGAAAVFTALPLFNKHNVKPEETKSRSAIQKITPLQKQLTTPKNPNKDSSH